MEKIIDVEAFEKKCVVAWEKFEFDYRRKSNL